MATGIFLLDWSVFHMRISLGSKVAIAKGQLSQELKEEAVILDAHRGVYYGLNSVGSRIWQLMRHPKLVREIRDAILAEYEVDSHQCEKDLITLLDQLAAKGLIEVVGGESQ
jgi:hypothetical protein